jgi:uncharacterized protein (UPF0548 family)
MLASGLSYNAVGGTAPEVSEWESGAHRFQITVDVGRGDECWAASRDAVLSWAVKTRSGFRVAGGPHQVAAGQDYDLIFQIGPITIREPIRVVFVVDAPDRCGFAYGTRQGHPVSGEEAFIVHREVDGTVRFTLRSLTMPGTGWRRVAFPVFRIAQGAFRRRYLSALRS